MKKIFMLFSILFTLTLTQAQWTIQNLGTQETFRTVRFANERIGWIVGTNGIILKSTDSGSSWFHQNSGTTSQIYSLFPADSVNVYACTSAGYIIKSTDGGETWNSNYVSSSPLNSIFFIDKFYGFCVGYNELIIRTTDAGQSWNTLIDGGSGDPYILTDVYFTDKNFGYVTGIKGELLTTSDGGITWYYGNLLTNKWLYSVFFVNPTTGFVAGQAIYKTTDAGITWVSKTMPSSNGVNSIDFVDQLHGWGVGYNGEIIYTSDRGETWISQKISSNNLEFDFVYMINLFKGFAVGVNGVCANFNDVPFSITITSPVGNEIWQTYAPHNITWNCNDDGNIKIEITTDNGTNWNLMANSIKASSGCYTFTVPPFQNSSNCKIRLTSLLHGNSSISPNTFTITSSNTPNLTVISPNNAVKWKMGSNQNITWTLTGSVLNAKLEYTSDNGTSWNSITNSTPASTQSYSWLVPNTASASCRIRISDSGNPNLNDVSDSLFSIAGMSIISPNGKEIWKAGTTKKITWTSGGVTNINIYFSIDGGSNWNLLNSNIPAITGSYSWTIPGITSTNCKVRLEDASDATLFSVSNNSFIIYKPIQSSQIPGLGTITQNFGATNIYLSAFVIVTDTITVTYYPYESPIAGNLPNGVAIVSQYYWTITSPGISFINGNISVPMSSLGGVTDATKLVWLKRTNSGDVWTNIGGSVSGGNLASTVYFAAFSEFAIGSTDTSNVLPVEIVSFNSNLTGNKIQLTWKTATEVNNMGFNVERSVNKSDWTKIAFVQGNGNSNSVKNYSYIDKSISKSGKYYYRLKLLDNNGSYKYSNTVEADLNSPSVFALNQNFPNPFNPSTTISYWLKEKGYVSLKVYDTKGALIKVLVNETKDPGYFETEFNAQGLASSIYFYKLEVFTQGNILVYSDMKKTVLLK